MSLKKQSLAQAAITPKVNPLEGLTDEQLLNLRREIDIKLRTDLTKIDLGEELGLQYRQGMVLYNSVAGDPGVPANHRSTVMTACSNMLSKIVTQQEVVFSAERLKRYEAAFMKVLQHLPSESTRMFFDLYGEFLKEDVPRETND